MTSDARREQLKALIAAHYDATINHQDLARIEEQLTADFVDHGLPPGTPRGAGPVKEWVAKLKTAFPDLLVTSDDDVVEGNRVAVRATWTGTHQGDILGVRATGRKVLISSAVFLAIRRRSNCRAVGIHRHSISHASVARVNPRV